MNTSKLLTLIGSTEPTTWREFCVDLQDDRPDKGDKAGWREIFEGLEFLEKSDLITIERRNGVIEQMQLTSLGAERAREALRKDGYEHGNHS